MSEPAKHPRDLDVRNRAFNAAMRIFWISKEFPREEQYSLTDQIRRSSRSVTANIAEAWQKRRYEASFVAKMIDALAEAGETQDWLDYALACEYISVSTFEELDQEYAQVIRTLNGMVQYSAKWCSPVKPHTTIDKPHPQ